MCMICIDLENMTTEQGIANLFEMMETLGKEHTNDVADMLADRICKEESRDEQEGISGGDAVDYFNRIGAKHMKMFIAIAKFVETS